jgi:hypothetical protein
MFRTREFISRLALEYFKGVHQLHLMERRPSSYTICTQSVPFFLIIQNLKKNINCSCQYYVSNLLYAQIDVGYLD